MSVGRNTSMIAVVACLVLTALVASLAPRSAAAERDDDSPGFTRLSVYFLDLIQERKPSESSFKIGGGLIYQSRVFWRDFTLSEKDFNLTGQAFVQFEGFRIDGMATYANTFNDSAIEEPTYYSLEASYLFRLEYAMLHIGARRHGFEGASLDFRGSDPVLYDPDEPSGFPNKVDEVFIEFLAAQGPVQGGASVNFLYSLGVNQRITSDGLEGTMFELGFTTLSQNAWVVGDVLSLSGVVRFNLDYLQPWGRFSTYMFTAKILKDISSLGQPGRGPFFIELWVAWHGAISDRYDNDVIFQVGIWAIL